MKAAYLEGTKLDVSVFKQAKSRLDREDLKMDIKLIKQYNHIQTIDNYVDRYMPIKIQEQINETLYSILSGTERRRLMLYESDKSFLLFK